MTRVFISYSHDSPEHAERVRGLAASLSRDGCDCRLDVHNDTDEDWPAWMTRQLIEVDFVLCVVTETYERRFRDRELPDDGRGVGWEAGLIRRLLYAKKLHNDRIFPVIFDVADRQHIPLELQGYDEFVLDGPSGYESLIRKVLRRPLHARPETGTPPELRSYTTEPLFARPDTPTEAKPASAEASPRRIARSRLLELGAATRFDKLVGRIRERGLLTRAWKNDGARILVFVAEGGVGKTSLVADWLMDFVKAGWKGVDAFFDWSFYSQGTRDQTSAHSGLFFDAALRHFGETELADSAASADQKADQLAECVARGRTLLVLDGVEPLQHPKRLRDLEGRFRDTGVERLLRRLAQMPAAGGLCVVTTRVSVVDLNRFHGATVREYPLDHLSDKAAAQVLHQAGARRAGEKGNIAPDDPELLDAARELQGHALAAQLLGGYLKQAHGGDIRKRDMVDWKRVFDEQQEGHAWQVMSAYERWFEQQGDTGKRQLAALRLLSFFDRPARADCLDALRGGEVVAGLTEPLAGVSDEEWNALLTQLAGEHRLISLVRRSGGIEQVDSHPLMREYFASQLRGTGFQPVIPGLVHGLEARATAWTEGHKRLFEHLCAKTEPRPDTLEGLQPLYEAVAHGCLAGLHERARAEVYQDRILRGTDYDGFYSSKKLGAIGADLGAVACFFEETWSRLSPNLSPADQAWLLNQAAIRLRALGRLTEAVEPMRAGLKGYEKQKDWINAARLASNLSELELKLGEVSAAVTSGVQSVDFAESSGDAFLRMVGRAKHADALHHAGLRDEARQRFAEAEGLQAERQPEYPRLYSLQGFRYCDLLLSEAERAAWQQQLNRKSQIVNHKSVMASCDDAAKRATQTLEWVTPQNWLLIIALDHLTLGRAGLYRALLSQSEISDQASRIAGHLAAAVDGLRQSGNMDDLPRGLLSRAWFCFLQDDYAGCEADLAEVQEIAERGPMPLFLADCHLTRARLFRDREALKEAEELLKHLQTQGYHRRDEELADALEASTTWGQGN